jgi:anti-sigma factor RsiW
MATQTGGHIAEETLEKYAMSALSEKVRARVEEHFLVCERCRRNLAAMNAYVAAMGQAAARLRQAEGKPKRKAPRQAGAK